MSRRLGGQIKIDTIVRSSLPNIIGIGSLNDAFRQNLIELGAYLGTKCLYALRYQVIISLNNLALDVHEEAYEMS